MATCTVCPAPADPAHLAMTGGGCDFPACSPAHAQAIWDTLDANAVDHRAPNPLRNLPTWAIDDGVKPGADTIDDLAQWLAEPLNASSLAAFRGA